MPRSAHSTQSAGSIGSRHGNTRKYYTVAKNSVVDETLFGKKTTQENMNNSSALAGSAPPTKTKKGRGAHEKETIRVITKDLVRTLIIPEEDPSGKSVVLSKGEYNRIIAASHVLSEEEQLTIFENNQKRKETIQQESFQRKQQMQATDRNRQKNRELSDLDEEARQKSEYLLQKATEQQEEREDEIKRLNEIILNAKCHAIRDAQIIEKQIIKKELTDEEQRLDLMMEVERSRAIQLQEDIDERKKQDRYEGASQIKHQIGQRNEERLLAQDRKDQESVSMLKYLETLQDQDLKDMQRKREVMMESQEEIIRANKEVDRQRTHKKDQERMADQRVLEFTQQKAQREEEYEAEQERIRFEKEKDIARLRSLQERAKDYAAEKDVLRAKRNQDECEREWRRKEKDDAVKKSELEEMLKQARIDQIRNKEHFLAVQAARDRGEFERVLVAQKDATLKDESNEKKFLANRDEYANVVRLQIREKEKLKANAQRAFFEEGVKISEEASQRRKKLDLIKRKKLDALRDAGVPIKYCAEVERQMVMPQGMFSK